MRTTELQAVLFDFGGVLAEEGFFNGLRALAETQNLDADMLTKEGRRAVHDSGSLTGHGTESDFWDLLRRRTGLRGSDDALTSIILSHFVLRPWMLRHVQKLRESGYVVAILSDQTDWLERLDRAHGFYSIFDYVFNSYRLGKTKHDETLFDDVITMLGLSPADALFIDDKKGHVRRALSRGLHAVRYESRGEIESLLRRLSHQRAIEELEPGH
jgi:putative hydrolase of the HAD superfamily